MKLLAARKAIAILIVGSFILVTIACAGSSIQGTYTNTTGLATLEISSGGKATFFMMGESKVCTYKVDGNKLTLDCQGDKLEFNIHEDGSLTGPGFIGIMKKSKS